MRTKFLGIALAAGALAGLGVAARGAGAGAARQDQAPEITVYKAPT